MSLMRRKGNSLAVWNVDKSDFPKGGKTESKIKFLIRYAILAASTHNTQPWIFKIEGNQLRIGPDFERSREAGDPEDRELFISLGCATKNLEVAAKYFGLMYEKEYEIKHKEGTGGVVLSFKNGQSLCEGEKMFGSILKRLTNRNEYEGKPIPNEVIEEITKSNSHPGVGIKVVTDKDEKKTLGDLIARSNRVWFRSKKLVDELQGWLRDDIEYAKDGLPTGVLNIYKIAVNLKYLLQRDDDEIIRKAERDRQLAVEAPALAVVYSKMDGVENWIKTGEYYQDLALRLTGHGVDNTFFNTILELKSYRQKLADALKIKGRPQLCLRLGYAKEAGIRSPRRPVNEVLVSTP